MLRVHGDRVAGEWLAEWPRPKVRIPGIRREREKKEKKNIPNARGGVTQRHPLLKSRLPTQFTS